MRQFIQIENDFMESSLLEVTDKNQTVIEEIALAIAHNAETYCHILTRFGDRYPTTFNKRHYVRKTEIHGLTIYTHEPPTRNNNEPYGTGYKAFVNLSQAVEFALKSVMEEKRDEETN